MGRERGRRLGRPQLLGWEEQAGVHPCFLQSSQDLPKVTKQVRKKQSAQAQSLTSRILLKKEENDPGDLNKRAGL